MEKLQEQILHITLADTDKKAHLEAELKQLNLQVSGLSTQLERHHVSVAASRSNLSDKIKARIQADAEAKEQALLVLKLQEQLSQEKAKLSAVEALKTRLENNLNDSNRKTLELLAEKEKKVGESDGGRAALQLYEELRVKAEAKVSEQTRQNVELFADERKARLDEESMRQVFLTNQKVNEKLEATAAEQSRTMTQLREQIVREEARAAAAEIEINQLNQQAKGPHTRAAELTVELEKARAETEDTRTTIKALEKAFALTEEAVKAELLKESDLKARLLLPGRVNEKSKIEAELKEQSRKLSDLIAELERARAASTSAKKHLETRESDRALAEAEAKKLVALRQDLKKQLSVATELEFARQSAMMKSKSTMEAEIDDQLRKYTMLKASQELAHRATSEARSILDVEQGKKDKVTATVHNLERQIEVLKERLSDGASETEAGVDRIEQKIKSVKVDSGTEKEKATSAVIEAREALDISVKNRDEAEAKTKDEAKKVTALKSQIASEHATAQAAKVRFDSQSKDQSYKMQELEGLIVGLRDQILRLKDLERTRSSHVRNKAPEAAAKTHESLEIQEKLLQDLEAELKEQTRHDNTFAIVVTLTIPRTMLVFY